MLNGKHQRGGLTQGKRTGMGTSYGAQHRGAKDRNAGDSRDSQSRSGSSQWSQGMSPADRRIGHKVAPSPRHTELPGEGSESERSHVETSKPTGLTGHIKIQRLRTRRQSDHHDTERRATPSRLGAKIKSQMSKSRSPQKARFNKLPAQPSGGLSRGSSISIHDQFTLTHEQRQTKREYLQLEKDYKSALLDANLCSINEIRIDQNDGLRARILEDCFYDIKKKYLEFREDVANEKEILFNNALEQQKKLSMMKKHKDFHQGLK